MKVRSELLQTGVAFRVSEAALAEMMANPKAAYAALAKGLADHLAIPKEQVTVTKTVPWLRNRKQIIFHAASSGTAKSSVEYSRF